MRIVTELMDRVFSDSTPQEFKDLVMEGIDKAFSEGSYELVGEGYNLSFSESEGSVAIKDNLNGQEVTIAKPSGNEIKLEGSATQPSVVVPKVEGETKPVEQPGSTQPDIQVSIEPAITDKDKAGKDKHFSIVISGFESEDDANMFYSELMDDEENNLTFSESEIEQVAFSANECHETFERLQGTGDVNLAFSLKEHADTLHAYSVLAEAEGYDMSDLKAATEMYSEYADDMLNQIFSDTDINEFFSELDEEEVQQYFSGLDEVEATVLQQCMSDTEDTYTFSEVEEIINEVYSEIELSQSVQEAFSEFSDEDLNEYFSQFTDQEAQIVYSALQDENITFSELNEQLEMLHTPVTEMFSEMSDEEIATFSEDMTDEEFNAVFSLVSENEDATYSDILDVLDYVNTFSDADAEAIVENTEELEKAAKAVSEHPEDTELAKKVKVLADKTSEDAEIAREAGYTELADEVQEKCSKYSEDAAEALDKAGVDPKSVDAEKILEEVKEAKATAEHANDKAGAAVQKAAEAKGEAAGAKADAAVAAEAAAATPAPDKTPEKPAEEPEKGEPKEEQKTHSKYAHVFGTETRAFSKGMPTKQTATPAAQPEQKVFSESTSAPSKSKYSTLKSAIN